MKYNEGIVQEIIKNINAGATNKDAAIMSGIAESTFYEWIESKPEFSESIKKAQAQRKAYIVAKILLHGEQQWQALAWYLERVYPSEFARKDRIEHSGRIDSNTQQHLPEGLKNAIEQGFEEAIRKYKPDDGTKETS